ncbi:MAG: ABC transporter ATP-binding protein [Candidatus Cloacimonetes bacterium]|nr:ABC transporter ATP-binding protein [Candidatus Cloacimonadota bacterium]
MEKLISIKEMFKHYPVGTGRFTALKAINLQIGEGEFSGIVGPSGSGKTTLLNIIGSLDVQSEGSVEVLGKDVKSLTHRQSASLRSEHIGFIFQTYNLLPVYTVYENVEFPLLLLDYTAAQRKQMVTDALQWVGLIPKLKSRPAQLSGGECQRVAIARAIVKKPQIVLADEPTANLDAENSHHILQTMVELNKKLGTTFVFSTHDAKVIKYLRRKITLIDGQIAFDEEISQ